MDQELLLREVKRTPLAQVYNDLFTRRQEGDYVDFVHFAAAQVGPWIKGAEQFVGAIAALIDEPGS